MKYYFNYILFLYCLSGLNSITAQTDEHNMVIFQTVLLYSNSSNSEQNNEAVVKQRTMTDSLVKVGSCTLAGYIPDDHLKQVLVFRNDSLEEVENYCSKFPVVQSEIQSHKVITWYADKSIFKTPASPLEMTNYIFGILVKDTNWTPEPTPEVMKIQEGHLANINRLAEMGKLVAAGPFSNGDDLRGIFIFKVNTIEEARELTSTDPAVIAGRLKIKLYNMQTYKGILP